MHPSLFEAIVRNDREMLSSLVQENGNILDHTTKSGLETALHLASKYGKEDLVMEIVKLKPEMVLAENKNMETPLHEACRQGNPRVVLMLLEAHPWVACKLNCNHQSALFLSSSNGHLNVVKILLSQPWLLDLEDDDDVSMSSLHVAASKGHTEIVREILKASPNLAQKMDENGCNPLHHACSEGHLDITRMLLKHDKGMALRVNNNGHTPLHLAAINGDATTLKAFMEMDPVSFHRLTTDGETVFHLAARFNRRIAFKFLAGAFSDTRLLYCPDQFGNTVLHVGVSGGHYSLAGFIINETRVKINQQNARGLTALDMVVNNAENSVELSTLREMLVRAGGKTSSSEEVEERPRDALEREYSRIIAPSRNYYSFENLHQISTSNEGTTSPQIRQDSATKTTAAAEPFKHDSRLRREELIKIYKMQHKKNQKVYIEAMQNARNTIILVAILIATVTFAAGINPPGGVHQDGRLGGRSMVGRTTAFRVFMISNNIALFTSLGIVVVLVSIIPFRRKPLMKLLRVAHKLLWVAVAFMAVAYVAGTCVIMPHGHEGSWEFEASVAICGGGLGTVFLWLGVVLVKHWLRKTKWKEEEEKKRGDGNGNGNRNGKGDNNDSLSSNSDVLSAVLLGYHAY
ncbi:unnamed protein product [Linum trigynum]|uniref:PGG domain-containing protein n=2 Tax=Linum trigynum TaxID=586398 RepID=A0AAV2DX42_9ROSI